MEIKGDLSKEEFDAYNEIISIVDKNEFVGIFDTDNNGIINFIMPPVDKNISMIVIFFLLNVMFNQRMRKIDFFIGDYNDLKKQLKQKGGFMSFSSILNIDNFDVKNIDLSEIKRLELMLPKHKIMDKNIANKVLDITLEE